MQNWLDIMTSRLKEAEEWVSDVEDKIMGEMKQERRGKLILHHKGILRELRNSIKCTNILFKGVPEEEEREKREEVLSEWIIVENFHKLGKETDVRI